MNNYSWRRREIKKYPIQPIGNMPLTTEQERPIALRGDTFSTEKYVRKRKSERGKKNFPSSGGRRKKQRHLKRESTREGGPKT